MGYADNVKETIIFEAEMFLIFGLCWAGAMYAPLLLTGSFNRKDLPSDVLIMSGLYLAYLVFRILFVLGRSFVRTYEISNQADPSSKQRRSAEEWITFLLLVGVWGAVMAWPLAINDYFVKASKIPVAILIIVLPYILYWLGRAAFQKAVPPAE